MEMECSGMESLHRQNLQKEAATTKPQRSSAQCSGDPRGPGGHNHGGFCKQNPGDRRGELHNYQRTERKLVCAASGFGDTKTAELSGRASVPSDSRGRMVHWELVPGKSGAPACDHIFGPRMGGSKGDRWKIPNSQFETGECPNPESRM